MFAWEDSLPVPVKQCVVVLLTLFALSFTGARAYALTAEFCLGGGYIGSESIDGYVPILHFTGSYQKAGANFLFSPWSRADFFVGAEFLRSGAVAGDERSIDYSFDVAAAIFGVRLKPVAGERWHLYVALGGLAGKAYYKADFRSRPDLDPLSSDRVSSYFVRPRLGIGAVIGLWRQWSMVIEASATKALPSMDIAAVNNNTGQIDTVRINTKGADMGGAAIGLRYAF